MSKEQCTDDLSWILLGAKLARPELQVPVVSNPKVQLIIEDFQKGNHRDVLSYLERHFKIKGDGKTPVLELLSRRSAEIERAKSVEAILAQIKIYNGRDKDKVSHLVQELAKLTGEANGDYTPDDSGPERPS